MAVLEPRHERAAVPGDGASLAACRTDERAYHRGPRAPARRLEKNIAHDGAVVPDEVLRSGRRGLSEADRKKTPTRKRSLSARGKISTQRAMVIHSDLQEAERTLLGTGSDIGGDGDAGAAGEN